MLAAFLATTNVSVGTTIGIGPRRADSEQPLPPRTIWFDAGHPFPDEGSIAGARRAIEVAAASQPDHLLVVLLSGGGSALMALPAEGISLDDKQKTARTLMAAGADIYELNTVRKHLSAIKGGQLAATAQGPVVTLAISDVVGDDLSVIASGPTVPDDSTFDEALQVLAVVGQPRESGGLDRVERLRKRAICAGDVVPIRFPVGRHVHELGLGRVFEPFEKRPREIRTAPGEIAEGDSVREAPVVEKNRDRAARPERHAIGLAGIDAAGHFAPLTSRLANAGRLRRRENRE